MHGDSVATVSGNFGVQGVAAPTNEPPGVYECASWKDTAGNFWIFGGVNHFIGEHSALWKYEIATNEWTWMKGPDAYDQAGVYGTKGVPDPSNHPGARGWGAASWTDLNGDFWLFGGNGHDQSGLSGYLNDLWKYDVSTNEWTWMSGSPSVGDPGSYTQFGVPNAVDYPSSRGEVNATWVDTSNNLWLFGGLQFGVFDDLWRYDITTGFWTWMHGTSAGGTAPNHGTKGVTHPANTPGARSCYSTWLSSSSDLMLFGGMTGFVGGSSFSDTWEFDLSLGQWTWVAGPSSPNSPGASGAQCDPSDGYHPQSRFENRSTAVDACGNVFTFGGLTNAGQYFNDLWWYDRENHEWSWIGGDIVPNQLTVFGDKGVPAPANKPGGRGGSVAWLDGESNFWVYGGLSNVPIADYNELWKFTLDSSCHIPLCTITFIADIEDVSCFGECDGSITLLVETGTPPFAFAWSTGANTETVDNLCPGDYAVTITDSDGNTTVGDFTITEPAQLLADAGNDTLIDFGETVLLNATSNNPAVSYNWVPPTDLSCTDCPDPLSSPHTTTTYTVTITDSAGCQASDVVTITVVDEAGVFIPNAFSPNGDGVNDEIFVYVTGSTTLEEFSVYNRWGELLFATAEVQVGKSKGWDGTFKGQLQPVGVYAYVVRVKEVTGDSKLVSGNISLLR